MNNNKLFTSHFANGMQIDAANYITELIIINRLKYWSSASKEPFDIPRCPFWQQKFRSEYPHFEKIANAYELELTFIKNLLHCFLPQVLISYIKRRNQGTLRFLKKAQQQNLVYDLWIDQCKLKSKPKPEQKPNPAIEQAASIVKKKYGNRIPNSPLHKKYKDLY